VGVDASRAERVLTGQSRVLSRVYSTPDVDLDIDDR